MRHLMTTFCAALVLGAITIPSADGLRAEQAQTISLGATALSTDPPAPPPPPPPRPCPDNSPACPAD